MMMIPVDDHMVHRGDGIFEAARIVEGAFFDLDAHLERLQSSAERIFLKLPKSKVEIRELCISTAKAAKRDEAALRLFVGRGVGSFSPNPYEAKESSLAIIITEFHSVAEKKYQEGVTAITSQIPQKSPFYAQIKSCNYLPNVLMKKESVDAGVDFSLGVGDRGQILEGATENVALLGTQGDLVVPKFDYTLRGTTLLAVLESLKKLPHPLVKSIRFEDVRIGDLKNAKEAFMIGTTLEVLPLVSVDGEKIGEGRPGPLGQELRARLRDLMRSDSARRTPIR